MTNKQRYYQEILTAALPELRNGLSWLSYASFLTRITPRYHKTARGLYELSEAIHNMYVSMFDPDYIFHDIWMLNHQFRELWESKYANTIFSKQIIGFYTRKLMADLPDEWKEKLEWGGPKEEEIRIQPNDNHRTDMK